MSKIKKKTRDIFYKVLEKNTDSVEINDVKEKRFLIDLFKYCYNLDENCKITIEKFNHSTYSRSFFISTDKKISVSYLNCLLKIRNAAKKIKKENNSNNNLDLDLNRVSITSSIVFT